MSIKRPVTTDTDGEQLFLCDGPDQDLAMIYREHEVDELLACINLAPKLAEALDDALDLIEGWLGIGRVELNPFGLEKLAERKALLAQWDAATGEEKG